MQKKIKEFFLKPNVLLVSSIVALLFWIVWAGACLLDDFNYELATDGIIYFAVLYGLLMAYQTGQTNIQKALNGSLLLFLCNSNIEILWVSIKYNPTWLTILYTITLVLSITIFVCHLLQQADHFGIKNTVFLNQCSALLATILLVYTLRQATLVKPLPVLDVTYLTAWLFTIIIVVCVETRIDTYKQVRTKHIENNTWNEENRKEAKKIFKIK